MPPVSKRVALVTGSTRGLGLAIAEQLAADGFALAINGRRPPDDIAPVIERLQASGAKVLYFQADVTDACSRREMIDEIRQLFGRLDVLVNNAGVAPNERADILEASEESFDRLIGINLKGPYFLTQLVANWMIEQRKADNDFSGTIVNISSISAELASVNRGDYCISKAGISMATKLWATRLAEYGIQVYEVRPGIFRTDMTDGVQEKYDKLLAEGLTLDPRWGDPAELGRAVGLLVSGELSYATGNVLNIDGGMMLPRL
ncbi:MAG: 3-ketoacyl-ACP reductase [Planctomycetes bacterium]|nr:3-ketoacyl-ACP reductase [Planctomycetota bacterium]